MGEQVLDVAQAARYLGLGETAFRRIVRTGAIPRTTVANGGWRFTVADLDTYLEEHARVLPGELGHLTRDEQMAAYRAEQSAQR